jgi:hypothetical protein
MKFTKDDEKLMRKMQNDLWEVINHFSQNPQDRMKMAGASLKVAVEQYQHLLANNEAVANMLSYAASNLDEIHPTVVFKNRMLH